MKNFRFKKTPILFLSVLCIPISAFGAFYYLLLENKGGRALAGAISLFTFVINLFVLFTEQAVLHKNVNLKKVWITEIVLILLIILFSIYFTD